jgi:amino acid adenylation domain-containing protein
MNDAPDGREPLTHRVAALSPAKRALLELRLKQSRKEEAAAANGLPPIVRRGPLRSAPLSFAQQRFWFLDQLQPGRPLYNVSCRAWLHGRVDVSALRRALNEIVARHETLRTSFPASNGQPIQSIALQVACDLPLIDLTLVPVDRREAEVRRLVTEQAREPFDLARGPLLRARLLHVAEDEHALILMLHHIVADDWSVGVLFRELGTLYEAFSQGRDSPLPELPIQYADYAFTQSEWLQGAVLERELTYWKAQFRTLPAPLQLPADRPRPAVPSHAGARVQFELPPALRDRLEQLSRSQGVTLFMTLLAAFKVLLSQYTGQEDIVVGTPIAGRTRAETEGLIGCFVNTLALRTDLSDDPTFRQLVARVREVALGAYAHQELPFERLVEELQPERDTSQAPLFNVMFVLQNVPRSERQLHGLTMRHIELDKDTAKFDLGLRLAKEAGGLRGGLSYSTDIFDRRTIERLVGQYRELLAAVVAEPDRRLSALPLLNAAERRTMLVDWNATRCAWSDGGACLHSLVARQAAATPEVVAIVDESSGLTYGELDRRANRLAHRLRRAGVGPEVRVGVCLERSVDLVVGLLAVLKAGGAYVPLDPSYPRERLGFMLRDSLAHVLLTQHRASGDLPFRDIQVVGMDAGGEPVGGEAEAPPETGVGPDNLAYVMYTSGSTGRPKGVMVSHRAVLNHLRWRQGYFPLSPGDRGLHKASVSFDDSVWEVFEPLLAGARLILARPGGQSDPSYLVQLISEQQITTACFVPSLLRSFLEEPSLESCASLRRVTTGGEVLSIDLQERFFTRFHAGLHNGYGPTEATISATFWTCERDSDRRTVPIGRPIANTRIYVVDRYLRPVPVGVPGELYIGGDSLARGYVGRAGATAERFLPDPFTEMPGARLYRTGDRARYRADGTLEFLGRLDDQVKIRGFRVEPGEIVATLAEHPGVEDGVVVAREDNSGDRRLVAYVVPAAKGLHPAIDELRDFLQARLPDHMIPSAFVFLEALPLTLSGKLDRRALPAPERARTGLAGWVTPRTPVEEAISEIWIALLNLEGVGVHDNFFALGGHSLLAVQVVARLRAAFGLDLPVRAFFETPTVAGLAERIEATSRLLDEVASLPADQVHLALSRENR